MADNGKLGDNGGLNADRTIQQPYLHRVGEQKTTLRSKHRAEDHELPEPPPDPWTSSWHASNSGNLLNIGQSRSLDDDEDIISYLTGLGTPPFESRTSECPSRNSVASTMAISNVYVGDAFEHLGRLYAFTEQILELRNRNTKFFKRVRNLERLKVLQTANKKLENAFVHDKDAAMDTCDEDTGFAESLLDAMLSNCRSPPFQKRNIRSGASRQAKSKPDAEKPATTRGMSASVPKVSKWTRVKAAFKWERAYTNDAEITDPAVITSVTTMNRITPTRCHRITDTEIGESKCAATSSCTNEVQDQGIALDQTSFTSLSNAGFYNWSRQSVSHNFESQSPRNETGKRGRSKNCRDESIDNDAVTLDTEQPKNAELTSEMNQRKPVIRITSEENRTYSSSKADERDVESMSKASTPILTIRIPSREDDSKFTSSPESHSPLFGSASVSDGCPSRHRKTCQELMVNKDFKRQQSLGDESNIRLSKMQRQDSKWNKVRRAFLTNSTLSVPSNFYNFPSRQMLLQDEMEAPVNCNYNDSVEDIEKLTRSNTRGDTRKDYQALREKLGAEFHRKLAEWERLKNMRTVAVAKDTREISSNSLSPRENLLSEERLTPDFKKKLQDWKRVKKVRRGSAPFEQQRINRRRLTDWQLWRSPSKAENRSKDVIGFRNKGEPGETGNDGKSHLCEDFIRKMEAWRKVNDTSSQDAKGTSRSKSQGPGPAAGIDESEFLALERLLLLFNSSTKKGRRACDVQQLDECFDADTRLYPDGTPNENATNEVLVRTSVGSYRFEGISREFTRKLYDWERYRGISPTSSTFRLLGPAYAPFERRATMETSTVDPAITNEGDEPVSMKASTLKRSKSAGSVIERRTEKEFYFRRWNSSQLLGFPMNDRFSLTDSANNFAVSIDSPTIEVIAEDTMDDSEPEAMIVDIEDVIEETASPLERVQPRQTPVYSVAASETTSIAVPLGTVTSSHEPSPIFLIEIEDSADENQWSPKSGGQRKSFTSEDSLSIEKFEMASRNFSKCEDTESEHWSSANSLNKETYENERSAKSNSSTSSAELVSRFSGAEVLNETRIDFPRESSPVVSTYDRNPIETFETDHLFDARYGHNQDLPSEEELERENGTPEEKHDESSTIREHRAQMMCTSDNEYEEVIVNDNTYHSFVSTNMHPMIIHEEEKIKTSTLTSTACRSAETNYTTYPSYTDRGSEKSKRHEENYGIIRAEVLNECCDSFEFRSCRNHLDPSKKCDEYWNGEEEAVHSRGTFSAEKTECHESRSVENTSTFLMLRATNSSTRETHREPTIRTTAYTVAPCREERCFERIIINEETLNKIVVPTATAGCLDNAEASKEAAACSVSEDSKEKLQHPSSTNRDAPVNQNGSHKKQIAGSPSRNVFIKTKRIIFSPFRRSEEHSTSKKQSCAIEQDQLLPTKSKSKSRSASPKVNRQDAFLRMSLSLPWPLRSSSRDRETKDPEVIRNDKDKQTCLEEQSVQQCWSRKGSQTETMATIDGSASDVSLLPGGSSSVESTKKKSESRYSVQRVNQSVSVEVASKNERQIQSSLRSSLPTLRGEGETNGARSSAKFDPYPSDLIYKLNILSNVVAKRDGKPDTISERTPLETHSLRIRRAKEDFLSRRGGPLCHSVLNTPPNADESSLERIHRYGESLEDGREMKCSQGSSTNNKFLAAETSSNGGARRDSTKENELKECMDREDVNEIPNNSTVSRADRIKSASAGMINVDPDTFVRLTEANRGCESLPRSISKQPQSAGPFAKIVARFKFPRFIRGKDTEEEKSTISKLCRQSLLIDVRNDFDKYWEADSERKLSKTEQIDNVKRSE